MKPRLKLHLDGSVSRLDFAASFPPEHPEQIKAAMCMKGFTPAALADELGVAKSTMSQVINGRVVSSRIRESIARVTGISVEVLWPPAGKPVLRRVKPKVAAQPHRPAKGAKP